MSRVSAVLVGEAVNGRVPVHLPQGGEAGVVEGVLHGDQLAGLGAVDRFRGLLLVEEDLGCRSPRSDSALVCEETGALSRLEEDGVRGLVCHPSRQWS